MVQEILFMLHEPWRSGRPKTMASEAVLWTIGGKSENMRWDWHLTIQWGFVPLTSAKESGSAELCFMLP